MHALKLKKTEDCFICDVNVNIEVFGVPVHSGAGNFSLLLRAQTGTAAHQASYPMGIWGFLTGSKAAGT
jgi:hypothetical protein